MVNKYIQKLVIEKTNFAKLWKFTDDSVPVTRNMKKIINAGDDEQFVFNKDVRDTDFVGIVKNEDGRFVAIEYGTLNDEDCSIVHMETTATVVERIK